MYKIGKVISNNNSVILVSVIRATSCGETCGSCKGSCETTSMVIQIKEKSPAIQGDIVEIYTDSKRLLKSAAIVYMTPILSVLLGIVFAYLVFKNNPNIELIGLTTGIILMGINYLLINLLSKKVTHHYSINRIIGHAKKTPKFTQ
jgi:sigma-E factor negative regulatory protein RseC